jgi:hypothetical protein
VFKNERRKRTNTPRPLKLHEVACSARQPVFAPTLRQAEPVLHAQARQSETATGAHTRASTPPPPAVIEASIVSLFRTKKIDLHA